MMRSLFILTLLGATAWAQIEDEPTPNPITVPDVVYRAVGERTVKLRKRDGSEVIGRVLAVDPSTVTMALAPSLVVVAVPRGEIVELQLAKPIFDAPPPVAEVQPPRRDRHFALSLGIAPSIDLDLDYRLFYGFFNISLVFPAASKGDWVAFASGAGVNFALGKNSGWKMEAFLLLSPMTFNREWWVGLGAGIGFHYTARGGFTVGFKIPIVGYAFTTDPFSSKGENVALFYLSAAVGMPLVSLGYRF